MADRLTRRIFVYGVSTAFATGLAGCSGTHRATTHTASETVTTE